MGRKSAIALGITAAGAIGATVFLLSRKAQAEEEDAEAQKRKAAKARQRAAAIRAQAVQARQAAQEARSAAEAAAAREAAAKRRTQAAQRTAAKARADAARARAEARDAQEVRALEQEAARARAESRRAEQTAKLEERIKNKAIDKTAAAIKTEDRAATAVAKQEIKREVAETKAARAEGNMAQKGGVVQQAFLNLVNLIQEREGVPRQRAVNKAAAFFKKQKISLTKPDPNVAFWQLPISAIQQQLATALNLYMGQKPPPKKAQEPRRKEPSVTTEAPPAKVKLVRDAYEAALVDTIAAGETQGKTLTVQNAAVPVTQSFAQFGVPAPDQLTAASRFWANPLSTIRAKTQQALNYHRLQIFNQTGYKPPGWEPKEARPSA